MCSTPAMCARNLRHRRDRRPRRRRRDGRVVFVNTLYRPRHAVAARPVLRRSGTHPSSRRSSGGTAPSRRTDGVPRYFAYATAVSARNIDGWRDRRASGGVVVDVQSGEIVIGGLSMPHSPRKLSRPPPGAELGGLRQTGLDRARRRQIPSAGLLPRFLRLAARFRRIVESLATFEGLTLDQKLADAEFRALVRRAGDRSQQRRLRALVPPRRRGGGTLRPGDRAGAMRPMAHSALPATRFSG